MRLDLRHQLQQGTERLLGWRNKYSKKEYPEKVALNVFYRKYTMDFMWDEIDSCFSTNWLGKQQAKWNDLNVGYQKLVDIYSETATSKTNPILMSLLNDHSKRVANTTYGGFLPLVKGTQEGNDKQREELEYTYLYHLLTDESILIWAAIGGTGKSKIDAIGQLTGLVLETDKINNYALIDQILGQFCSAAYLHKNYRPLPLI